MLYWLPALAWMGVIFYLSSRTGDDLQSLFPFINDFNPGHIAAYFILALLCYFALRKNGSSRPYLISFLLCVAYGISDEIHQYFVPTSYPDAADLARDILGAALALGAIYLHQRLRRSSKK